MRSQEVLTGVLAELSEAMEGTEEKGHTVAISVRKLHSALPTFTYLHHSALTTCMYTPPPTSRSRGCVLRRRERAAPPL